MLFLKNNEYHRASFQYYPLTVTPSENPYRVKMNITIRSVNTKNLNSKKRT